MTTTSMPETPRRVIVGVDTHGEVNVAATVDDCGRLLGSAAFPTTVHGHRALVAWATALGGIEAVGVEGTGSFGAGLARYLTSHGHRVVEVDRPNRQTRRRRGKSDTIDAEAAARAVLAGTACGTPKSRTGTVEAIRVLRLARRSAIQSRTQAANQLHDLVLTAPDELRGQLRQLRLTTLVDVCARLRPVAGGDMLEATKLALKLLANRWQALSAEVTELDLQLGPMVHAAGPQLVAMPGIGVDVAGQLLVTAGDNPDRIHSEAAFAHLCGAAPIPASSGRTDRHRLNRGGDRHANAALYRVVICRMRWDPRTVVYVARRTEQGLSKPEIIRCLKRYIAREVFGGLQRTAP